MQNKSLLHLSNKISTNPLQESWELEQGMREGDLNSAFAGRQQIGKTDAKPCGALSVPWSLDLHIVLHIKIKTSINSPIRNKNPFYRKSYKLY